MTNDTERRFSKSVRILEKDADEQTVTGAVLVPWEVDRQGDWLDPDGVQAMFNPTPDEGVLHAVFPDDDAETIESYITGEQIELGGEQFPPGTWVIRRRYLNDELWSLVEEEVLPAFSIGGTITQDQSDIPVDELPEEVTFPEGVEEGPTTQLINGATDEISDVDIPAVPRAIHATAKSLGKSLYDGSTGQDEFVDTMRDRGHSEDDAERLFEYLDTAAKVGPAAAVAKFADLDSGEQRRELSMTRKDDADVGDLDGEDVGFLKWLRRRIGGSAGNKVDEGSDDPPTVSPTLAAKGITLLKDGHTLNQANRERLMAAHDAIESALTSEMDYETNRFTDNDEYDFDLTDYEDKSSEGDDGYSPGKSAEKLTVQQGEYVVEAIEEFLDTQGDATYAEFREWAWQKWEDWDSDKAFAVDEAISQYRTWTNEMHDTLAVTEEFGPWIEDEGDIETDINMTADIEEKVDQLEKELADLKGELTEKNSGDDPDGDGDVDKDARIEELEERVDKLSKSTADTDQIGAVGAEETGAQKSAIELEKEVFTG